jgi:hypothetical protein
MNTFEFLAEHFAGQFAIDPNISCPVKRVERALSMPHPMTDKLDAKGNPKTKRFMKGAWAVVYNGGVMTNSDFMYDSILIEPELKAHEAFLYAVDHLPGPWCFLTFTNAAFPLSNIYLTFDPRVMRVCSPGDTETFNLFSEASTPMHKRMMKAKKQAEKDLKVAV